MIIRTRGWAKRIPLNLFAPPKDSLRLSGDVGPQLLGSEHEGFHLGFLQTIFRLPPEAEAGTILVAAGDVLDHLAAHALERFAETTRLNENLGALGQMQIGIDHVELFFLLTRWVGFAGELRINRQVWRKHSAYRSDTRTRQHGENCADGDGKQCSEVKEICFLADGENHRIEHLIFSFPSELGTIVY